ncbi:related to carboxypeptidase S1 [Cephalotrichum gorgonifer]|uniref:Carboxypeptidase n=1 Tax=Cephalotrichum gorgonifer TaxID=2041049 RepID=A0AAE8MP74_9PEZI|nr:related to carboxypeptidase S1 [Cephalotrichum gorgonifer]
MMLIQNTSLLLFVLVDLTTAKFPAWSTAPNLQASFRYLPPHGKRAEGTLTEVALSNTTAVRFKETKICETTAGVKSYSGYVHLGDVHTFFWFFEARKDAETAPVTLWLNGGPGSDSLIGLFTEIGPCKINPDLTTTLNPSSWNEESNLLFLSQPIGVGFSHGAAPGSDEGEPDWSGIQGVNVTQVDRTEAAAIVAWHTVQAILEKLPDIGSDVQSREFHLWTESYGGHYGPAFYRHFQKQNYRIRGGEVEGIELELRTLGIGNGIIDAATQFPFYPNYAANNTYSTDALDEKWIDYMTTACYMVNGCLDQLWRCKQSFSQNSEGVETRALCSQAANMCRDNVEGPYYAYSERSMYDVRRGSNFQAYPDFFVKYLNLPETQEALGVDIEFEYQESSYDVYLNFQHSGDYAYPGFLEDLEYLLDKEIRVLLVYGDADYIGNWLGGEAVSLALNHAQAPFFRASAYRPLTSGGEEHGKAREFGSLGFAVVRAAGHLVPIDKPGVALDIFRRAIRGKDLASGEKERADMVEIPFAPDVPWEPEGEGGGEDAHGE